MITLKPTSSMEKCFADESIHQKIAINCIEALKGEEIAFPNSHMKRVGLKRSEQKSTN